MHSEEQEAEVAPEDFQQHLVAALNSKAPGRAAREYNDLLQEISKLRNQRMDQRDKDSDFFLCTIVEHLTYCISAISERQHGSLISELYTIQLWECTKELRAAVLGFMLNLVVMNSTMTQQTLQVLVYSLNMPYKLALQQQEVAGEDWQPSEQTIAVQDDIIAAIEQILALVPVSGSLLEPILARGVPNKILSRNLQCTYLRALFCIAELPRATTIRDTILATVVQHLVSLDVEIRWQDISFSLEDDEDEEEDEDEGEEDRQDEVDIFELEGQTEHLQLDPSKFHEQPQPSTRDVERREGDLALERITGRGGFEGEAKDNQPSTSGRTEVDEAAEKLDSMMTLVFQHLQRRSANGQLYRTWDALSNSFFSTVLNTHRSKFTQYLLWYMLDQDPEMTTKTFLKRLMAILADSRQPAITRSASAAYIASFLARAAFLPDWLLIEAIEGLADWCLQYCKRHEILQPVRLVPEQGSPADPTPQGVVHQVFYAACQGLLYVLCYRLEQLMASRAGRLNNIADAVRHLFKEAVPVLLRSRLAPMAVCLPTVVAEFTRLTARLELMDCRGLLPEGADAVRCQRPLEMFFPFDPYLLRRSAAFLDLRRTFVRWKEGHSQATAEDGDATVEGKSLDGSQDISEDEASETGSESSGLDSDADGDQRSDSESELSDHARPAKEIQNITPGEMPPARTQSAGKRIRMSHNAAPMAASYSSAGTGSPSCPMSWTPKLPEGFVHHQHALLSPLDVHD